ncbi:MAG: hypothetical protein KAQ97_08990, partial [Candidatus Fermentibacteraceae bacterium]|nr:hypothetical protein [Candidatus Fermentibacteraceae bacterium]
AYVSCYQEDRIYFLDLSSGTAVGYILTDIRPNGICSVPSGEYVYFSNSISSTVHVLGYSGPGWPH